MLYVFHYMSHIISAVKSATDEDTVFLFYRKNRPTITLPSFVSFSMSLMKLKRELTSLKLRSTSYVQRVVMWGQRSVTDLFFLAWDI